MAMRMNVAGRLWFWIIGLALIAAGGFFAWFGWQLVTLGGTPYFVVAGVGVLIAGLLTLALRPEGPGLLIALFAATVVWAVAEAGLEFWPLHSRLFAMGVAAFVLALSYPWLARHRGYAPARGLMAAIALVIGAGLVWGTVGMFRPHPPVAFAGTPAPLTPVPQGTATTWQHYGNTSGGSRFVAADQITRDNVDKLEVAWTYHTGDVPISPANNGAEDQETPLQVGNRLYLCTPHNNIIALEANTGREIWKTEINAQSSVWMRCRGLAYFDADAPLVQPTGAGTTPVTPVTVTGNLCRRRILMNTIQAELIAVDADTGAFCPDFGTNGRVDLKVGLGNAPDPQYVVTSAPTLAGTTVVIGGRIADNVQVDMPGGVMRGFDVVTGAMRWAFDPGVGDVVPQPGPGQSYTRSTPNVWAAMSYDPALNTVFMPVGSPSVDLYGATRTPEDLKYGASILALDATTGKERWHFQTVHNDLWDFDVPMQPSFVDFPTLNGTVPALVFGTKAGQLYVLDRASGQPLTRVVEQPVPAGNIPGERYAPTQPRSVGMPQIGAATLTEADMWGATPFDQLLCRVAFKGMRYSGLYTPPGLDKALMFPGSLGGMNWGGLSTDPTTGTIFANDMRVGLWIRMIPAEVARVAPQAGANDAEDDDTPTANAGGEAVNTGMGLVPMRGTPYAVDKDRFLSPVGIPCQKPPFGTLSAVDMATGSIKWQVPVGTVQDTGPFGIKMRLPMNVGMPTLGGTLATQGGLVFIAGTQDYYLRAYDSATGREVWKARLPVGSQGGPMSYVSPADGRQYVVISAGGARQSPDRGDYVIAYALPR